MRFSASEARARRDRAMERVQIGKAEWSTAARWAVYEVALRHKEFTTDAVWAIGLAPPERGSARALGPVMAAAQRAGIIERTDRTRATAKAKSHAQPLRVWRSRLI